MKIVVGFDEATAATDQAMRHLQELGHTVEVLQPAQWPEVAEAVARRVAAGEADQGLLFCWTGTGTAMAANKVPGVRAALCWEPWVARGARLWNDANVLVMSSQRLAPMVVVEILDAWFAEPAPDPDELANIERLDALERATASTRSPD